MILSDETTLAVDKIDATLESRQINYGDFTSNAALSQALKDLLRAHPGWKELTHVQKEALEVICQKISRIVSGTNPNYKDNWHDIQGYAKLAEERCKDGD